MCESYWYLLCVVCVFNPLYFFHALIEWLVVAYQSLPILGVLAVLAVIISVICCFVRRPEKMPAALVSGSGLIVEPQQVVVILEDDIL